MVTAEPVSRLNHAVRQPLLRHLWVLTACAALAACGVFRIWQDPLKMIPTTTTGSATVPLFNTWTILWNVETAGREDVRYWDAPIFWPMTGTFALSEPQPLTIILTPLSWAGASPAMLYNVWLLFSLTLNGYFAWLLLNVLGCRLIPACAGAAGMVFHPMVHDQLDVLQLVALWPSLWVILTIVRFRQIALSEDASCQIWILLAAQAGIALFCAAATCLHHCLFLVVLLGCSAWVLVVRRSFGRWLFALAISAVVASSLILPWLLPMRSILRANQFTRDETLVAQLSATPADLISVSAGSVFPSLSRREGPSWYLSPGNLRTLLAVLSLPTLIWLRRQEPSVQPAIAAFLIAFVVASGVLSLGTNLEFGGVRVWAQMSDFIPGLAQIRSAFRFGYFYQMGILLLCSITLNSFFSRLSTTGWQRIAYGTLISASIGVVALEVLPTPLRLIQVPSEDQETPWISTLEKSVRGSGGLLIVPFAPGSDVSEFEWTSRWMISFVSTELRLVNGYSGFFPRLHYDWQKFLASKPAPWQLAERMRANNVEFVVIMDDEFQKLMNAEVVVGLMFEEIRMEDSQQHRIFRLR